MPIAPAPGAQPQQPPFGVSPATGPTPNKGYEAAAVQKLGMLLKGAETILPLVGSGSEMGKDVLKVITILSKHVQPGAVSPASEKNQIEQMAMRQQQNAAQMAQMKQPGAQQAQPGMAA